MSEPTQPTDDLSMDDFFAAGNALERGQPVAETAAPVVEAVPVEEPPAGMERDAQGKFVAKTEKPAEKKVGKPRDDPEARVQQAVTRQREAERRAEDAERRLAANAKPVEQPKPVEVAKPTTDEPDPADLTKYPDGQYDRKFIKDQARWEARQEIAEREALKVQETQRRQQEDEARTLDETWKTRLAEAKAKTPDLIASINPETPLSAPMMHVIKESEVGVQLLKYLSDHQDESQRLSTLHPGLALREMGKLEARLEAATTSGPAPVVPIISNAKAPIKPLETSHVTPAGGPPDDSASVDDHIRYYNGQDRKARRA